MSNGVTYVSYEAAAVGYAIAMLTSSQTFVGLASALSLGGNDIVIESTGGLKTATGTPLTQVVAISGNTIQVPRGTPPTTPFAVVHSEDFITELIALNTNGYHGDIEVDLYLPMVAGDAPGEVLRRVRNVAGMIRSEVDALWGGAGFLLKGHAELVSASILDPTTDLAGYCQAVIMMHWSSP